MRLRLPTAAVLAVAAAAAAAPAAHAGVHVSADPALYPSFSRSVSDYVSRCVTGQPLRISVRATHGDRVRVGSRRARGGNFTVDLQRASGAGVTLGIGHSTYHIRCLPTGFPAFTAARHGRTQAQWYVVAPTGDHTQGYVAIFDADGVPVWWWRSSSFGPWDGKLLPDGNLAWARYYSQRFGMDPNGAYEERSFDGRLKRRIRTSGIPTDTHDLEQLGNGNYLVEGYKERSHVDLSAFGGPSDANVFDGVIQEVTPRGKVVWSWSSKDHIKLSETGPWWPELNRRNSPESGNGQAYDLVHLNSIQPDGKALIVSFRHLDAVYKIDRRTGRIDWKLGGTHTSKSLREVGSDPEHDLPLAGQHDARLWHDGTLTLFDNNTNTPRPPRVLRFRIDAQRRTARIVESHTLDNSLRSACCGSARKLAGGDWVVYWAQHGPITELKPSGRVVFQLEFPQRWGYRAYPIEHGLVSARTLRRAMDRMSRRAVRSSRWR